MEYMAGKRSQCSGLRWLQVDNGLAGRDRQRFELGCAISWKYLPFVLAPTLKMFEYLVRYRRCDVTTGEQKYEHGRAESVGRSYRVTRSELARDVEELCFRIMDGLNSATISQRSEPETEGAQDEMSVKGVGGVARARGLCWAQHAEWVEGADSQILCQCETSELRWRLLVETTPLHDTRSYYHSRRMLGASPNVKAVSVNLALIVFK